MRKNLSLMSSVLSWRSKFESIKKLRIDVIHSNHKGITFGHLFKRFVCYYLKKMSND